MSCQTVLSHGHAVYSLFIRIVLITHEARPALKSAVRKRLGMLFEGICEKAGCRLVCMEGTDTHICLLIAIHPSVTPSRLVNTLKTISSRVIRKEFPEILAEAGTPAFLWHRSYGLTSVNGASAERLLEYLHDDATEIRR